jgi:hypothetical protein
MKAINFLFVFCLFIVYSCKPYSNQTNAHEFNALMSQLAKAWTTQNTDMAIECFASDAVYMQPPDEQLYIGHDQLRPFFGALKEGTVMTIHNTSFDPEKQIGAAEFTFGNVKSGNAVTGVTIVAVENGKIKTWREYFISGPIDFEDFISTENKKWKWTIDNYP